jgi:mannose/fructose/N-acetylgalactosamine-specific phosphotransferase system component IIC
MFLNALYVGIVGGLLSMDVYGWGTLAAMGRPIVLGPLMGLLMGDFQTGLWVGATIEFMFLGVIPTGAAIPPDATMSALGATALAILLGGDRTAAIALAVPLALLGQLGQIIVWQVNAFFLHKADDFAERLNLKGIENMHYVGMFLFFLRGFIPLFLGVWLGVEPVQSFLNSMPDWVSPGLGIAAGLLPAVGFGMLLNMIGLRRFWPYFLIGFVLATFFSVGIVPIAIIGLCMAIIIVGLKTTQLSPVKAEEF